MEWSQIHEVPHFYFKVGNLFAIPVCNILYQYCCLPVKISFNTESIEFSI